MEIYNAITGLAYMKNIYISENLNEILKIKIKKKTMYFPIFVCTF